MSFVISIFWYVLDYVETTNKWCWPHEVGKYNNLLDVQNACNNKEDCKVFYDIQSANNSFVICNSNYLMKESDYLGSRLYTKCNIFTGSSALITNASLFYNCNI